MKNKKLGYVLGRIVIAIILVSGAYFVGTSTTKTKIEGKSYTLNELSSKLVEEKKSIDMLNKDTDSKRTDLSELKQDVADLQSEKKDIEELIVNRSTIEEEVAKKEEEKKNKQIELDTVNGSIVEKNAELEKLTYIIVAKKQEPIQMPAGNFVVGTDVPAGRYKIEPNGWSGNYFVNEYKTNIILGVGDSFQLSEYIISLKTGDKIEQGLPVKYTAVE